MIQHRTFSAALSAAAVVLWSVSLLAQPSAAKDPAAGQVTLTQADGKLRIEINGELFSEYHYEKVSRPFFHPVIGPGGARMTRDWPILEGNADEAQDHPHHRSLWYAHGDVNGHDFWSESDKAGTIAHEKFLETRSGKTGIIKSRNRWVAKDGTIICTDERTISIRPGARGARYLDFDITLQASHGDITLGDTKEGSMAIRLAPTIRLKGKVGKGHIINSQGTTDGKTWGDRAKWCDYYGPVNGKTVGVAIFDHPENPRHPTWWHVRDYGLFAANPFGVHDFEKKAPGTGDLKVPSGKSVTFRYRFYFHEGTPQQADIEKRYQEYALDTNEQP